MRNLLWLGMTAALTGCSAQATNVTNGGSGTDPMPQPQKPEGVALLGSASHDPAMVELTVIATSAEFLEVPRDLAFHPVRQNELWVVNRGDESVVVITDPGTPSQHATRYKGPDSHHFLAQPAALAFADNGNFATIHETDEVTQPDTPAMFMGPTLWTSNMAIFDGGVEGHIDMLHNSPDGMGIAWEKDNVYWVFDGYHGAVTRYDFHKDHGPGGTDHSDGEVDRYVQGQVKRQVNIPSGMVFDHATKKLYFSDTGNNRIAVLDTTTGKDAAAMTPNYDDDTQIRVDGAQLATFIDSKQFGNAWPSGLEVHDGYFFVSDYWNSTLYAYSDKGELVDYLPLPPDTFPQGSLEGMAFDGQGRLYLVDALGNRIIRIAAKDAAK